MFISLLMQNTDEKLKTLHADSVLNVSVTYKSIQLINFVGAKQNNVDKLSDKSSKYSSSIN